MLTTARLACASIVIGVSATLLAQVTIASPATASIPPDERPLQFAPGAVDPAGVARAGSGVGQEGHDVIRDSEPNLLDGFEIRWLPDRVGPHVSDFTYEWEGVTHHSRVWERGPDDSGGYHVDLTVKVLRGEEFRDLQALRDYLADYHERDDDWALVPFDHHGHHGYRSGDQVFWLQAPGVAGSVTIDPARFTDRDLTRTALGIHPAVG
jgi:hypothetical protein